jgi:carboxyl-terminal processing protease
MLLFSDLNAMIRKFGRFVLLLSLVFPLSPLRAAEALAAPTNSAPAALKPGPDAGKIAFYTTYMLEKLQYLQHDFDSTMSARLFDGYLTALDPQHMHFLQSDLDEFAAYRTNLTGLMMPRRTGVSDTRPAYVIFERYMDRLKEHVDYVDQSLKTEKFDFTANDRVTLNRHDLPYPKNLDEAKQIWRDRLRYEFMTEKINRESNTNSHTVDISLQVPSNFIQGPITFNGTNVIQPEHGIPTPVLNDVQVFQGSNKVSPLTITTNQTEKSGPPKSMHDEIVDTLGRSYHRMLKAFRDWDSNDVLNQYLESLARAYDPHSDYQGPDEYEDFAMQMNLSLSGIGAQLRSEDGYCKIEELLNGPAKASGKIKVGDRIMKVAQSNQPPVDIRDMPITKAVHLIRGQKGTQVTLTLIPVGASEATTKEVSITRDEIKLENGEAKGKIYEVPGPNNTTTRLGLIDLPSFYATIDSSGNPTPRSTTADVAEILKKFRQENVSGVILDLRHNGGGSLEEAIKLAGLFIKEGPVVQIRRAGPDGEVDVREDTDPSIAYNGPLLLFTSRFSASASEIVAGALQDYGRALIVGDSTTFGKGTAQQIYYLSKIQAFANATRDPGTLKLTNSKFYRASGASTENHGVSADITLPSLWNDSTEIGETNLDNHLDWDTIGSSHYQKVNMVQPALAELVKRSNLRTATNKEFAYLRADIERFRKQREEKTLSLNEKQQLAERAQIIAEHKQREAERAARKATFPKVYDFTVKQAGEPGLPAPTKQTNDLDTASVDLDSVPETPSTGTDELTEAVTSETAHADAARLQEAKNILTDYIAFWNAEKQGIKDVLSKVNSGAGL